MKKLFRILLVVSFILTQCVGAKAAITSNTVWRIRVGGSNTNGGGYDSTISGATTDYTDQDAAQLTVTDIVTIGNTTVTSVTGGFTTAMIGNCLRIVGDNYYFITARASSNSITVDRNTGTAVAQTGSIGGAFATQDVFWTGGSIAQPSITSPLAPGHIVYIRGSGTDNPSSDDYTYPATDYSIIPNGDGTSGKIQFIGYNGRPRINNSGLMFYQAQFITLKNLFFFLNSSPSFPQYGLFNTNPQTIPRTYAEYVKVDTNGNAGATVGLAIQTAIRCTITNSGTTSPSGTGAGLYLAGYAGGAHGCTVEKQRANGIRMETSISIVKDSLIVNNGVSGITLINSANYGQSVIGNTIDGNAGDGITFDSGQIAADNVYNNIVSNNGGYCLNAADSSALNDKLKELFDYNDLYNCTSGLRNNLSAGTHDLNLDPQFTNSGSGDYSIGTNLKAMGYPSLIGPGTTTSYVDIGGAQRQETGGGAAAPFSYSFAQ